MILSYLLARNIAIQRSSRRPWLTMASTSTSTCLKWIHFSTLLCWFVISAFKSRIVIIPFSMTIKVAFTLSYLCFMAHSLLQFPPIAGHGQVGQAGQDHHGSIRRILWLCCAARHRHDDICSCSSVVSVWEPRQADCIHWISGSMRLQMQSINQSIEQRFSHNSLCIWMISHPSTHHVAADIELAIRRRGQFSWRTIDCRTPSCTWSDCILRLDTGMMGWWSHCMSELYSCIWSS